MTARPTARNIALLDPWHSPKHSVRRAYLCDLRESQPAQARRLLQSTWNTEEASVRRSLLNTFSIGISMEDEPFLECILDDRARRVRQSAAYLLSDLPDSRLTHRLIAEAAPLLTYHKGSPSRMEVKLPTAYTPQMERDFIFPKSNNPLMSNPAFWLNQMILRIAPGFWESKLNATPPEIIAAAFNTEQCGPMLITAWIEATARYHDPHWPEALLAYDLTPYTTFTHHYLLSLVPAGRRETVLQKILSRRPNVLHTDESPIYMLYSLERPWSLDFSRFVLDRLTYYANPATPQDPDILKAWYVIEPSLDPAIYPEAQARLGPPNPINPYLTDAIATLLTTLQQRHHPTQ